MLDSKERKFLAGHQRFLEFIGSMNLVHQARLGVWEACNEMLQKEIAAMRLEEVSNTALQRRGGEESQVEPKNE